MGNWPYLLLMVVGGVVLPLQAGVNAQLATRTGDAIRAALVSFLVGAIALVILSLIPLRPGPAPAALLQAPWWIWIGGLVGAMYVIFTIISAPRLGAATLVVAAVTGQAAASIALDNFGWAGFTRHPVTAGRMAGMALLVVGLVLVRRF
ncbi:MAG TPA: DMT family transporter [Candidatus Dormibacteraeota bacterium]|jgi:transporter family-2 protein